jgi:type II secretory pathway pseudopilin PulG
MRRDHDQPNRLTHTAGDQSGSTLVEAMVALFVISMVLTGVAQMIGFTMLAHRVSEDVTAATVLAEDMLEQLKNTDYDTLTAGGSIAADAGGFFDSPDVDGNGTPDYNRRWQIQDVASGKVVSVRVISPLATSGPAKEATVFALIAEP